MLKTKEHLLRAITEIYSNNYGLASQQLGLTRKKIKKATKLLRADAAKKALELYEKITGAQTLTMRLDPMSRVHVEQLLSELQKLPGAK